MKFVCVFIAIMGFLLILKDKLVEVTFKDWLSIKTSAAEASADAKTIASIKQQVENQRATIDLIATEAQTAKNLSEEASNKIALAEQKLKDLDDAIQKANGSLKKLDAAAEFTLLVTKAESGNRSAFFKLIQMLTTSPTEAKGIPEICNAIISKICAETMLNQLLPPVWDIYGIDPQKSTIQQFKDYYSTMRTPMGRFNAIKQVFNDNRFSELERFDFVALAMQQDDDLGVLQEACQLMDTKRKSKQVFVHVDDYLSWYRDNRAGFKTNSVNQP